MASTVRVLVVGNAGALAERLGRQLAGVAQVDLETAPAAALVRALIERPAAVLYALPANARDFAFNLRKAGLEDIRFLHVTPRSSDDGELDVVAENSLLEALADLLTTAAPVTRQPVEMLASLGRLGHGDGGSVPSFANVLELGEETVLIEAPLPLECGDRLALGFFLQRDAAVMSRRISLTGTVRSVLDERRLHYVVAIDHSNPALRQTIREYLAASDDASNQDSKERPVCRD